MWAQSPLNTIQANSSNLKVFAAAQGCVQNNTCSIKWKLIRKNKGFHLGCYSISHRNEILFLQIALNKNMQNVFKK